MTEGTSQGLFIVVAIVIFGIFVGLSYLIFEDTLSPKMVAMFESSFGENKENPEDTTPTIPETDASLFTVEENDVGLTITGYIGDDMDINIPSKINNKKVTEIGNEAFMEVGLTSVLIPNTVLKIGTGAFSFNEVTSIVIPDSVTVLGGGAFCMNKLEDLKIGKSITVLPPEVFAGNKLMNINIPDTVTEIGDYAFASNSLESIEIGKAVETMGLGVFMGNTLINVVIPDSVTEIGEYAFAENPTLKTVELPYGFESNPLMYQEGAIITNRTK